MKKRFFEEKQRFNQWWLWILILTALGVAATSTIKNYNGNLDELIVPLLLFSTIILLFLFLQLRTKIDDQGIHVQFFPFHLKAVTYSWAEIYSAEVLEYSPIGDYGGWGIRISLRGKGKAFNIRGNKGIKIVTVDGRTRMIGTQNTEEAAEILAMYKEKMG